jgi:hypothetical protein
MADLIRQVPINYELIRVNRFELQFPSDLGIESWMVAMSGRPKYSNNIIEIPFINGNTYVIGRYKWDKIDIEFIQSIGPSTGEAVTEWLRLHTESLTGRQGYAKGYAKDLVLNSLDPTGVAVESWLLEKCIISDIDYGSNDHGNDEVQKIKDANIAGVYLSGESFRYYPAGELAAQVVGFVRCAFVRLSQAANNLGGKGWTL